MPKNLHHDTRAHSLGQHERRSGVPQVMQPNMAQTGGADQPLEVQIVIARRQGRAEARCEYEAPVLPELNARCEPIGPLLLTPQLQGVFGGTRWKPSPGRYCSVCRTARTR